MPANQPAITRGAVCPAEKKMEPQNTPNTQRRRFLTDPGRPRLISRRGFVPTHFIDVLKKSGSRCVEHRQGAADDSFGEGSTPPSSVSICVFGVFCGSIWLYCGRNLADSLIPANPPAITHGAVCPRRKWNRKSRRTRKGGDASQAQGLRHPLQRHGNNERVLISDSVDIVGGSPNGMFTL
jgi:hypothetical protein